MARFAGTALTDYFNTPDFTTVGKTNMQGQSLQRNSATKAEGLVHGAGINSMAQVAQAGFQADAIKAQGQAQGQASMMSGIGSMVSGIAGGFGARGSTGSKVKDLSGLDYNDPTNFSFNAAPKYLDKPNIDTSWSGWGSI